MLLALVFLSGGLSAQQLPVGDDGEDYYRLLGLVGKVPPNSFVIRPSVRADARVSIDSATDHPWSLHFPASVPAGTAPRYRILDPQLHLYANSAFPAGQNDGVVWQGRGVTAALDGGVFLRAGPVSATLRPELIYTQNRAFPLASVLQTGRTIYANPYHPLNSQGSIDLPQRFGPDPFWKLDPGQSSLRLDYGGATLGVATENLWWGPGIRNAIVMSNNAPGFPHAFLATGRPVNVGIGRLEALWTWGWLARPTGFSDSLPSGRHHRFLTGLAVAFEPKPFPGLFLGGTRLFYEEVPASGLGFGEYFLIFQRVTKKGSATPSNPTGNDQRDQLASLFARWLLPGSGFEVYVEWARNDFNWDLRDLFLEPEHSQAYTIGFQKGLALSNGRLLRLNGELTHLERSATLQVRATPAYYVHSLISEGYTQRGQVIGAGIGPGSDAQYLGADLFTRWGRIGTAISRQVHDNDAYYATAATALGFQGHYVEGKWDLSGLVFLPGFDLGGTLEVSRHLNRYYLLRNDHT
ncbi:MAG: capsule assembly Wzi family protein, partial [Gemmatimonadales bacterium]